MALISVAGLTKVFGSRAVLSDISFEINRNERVGLIGPNGAGKTTLFRLLLGLLKPTQGEIIFDEQAVGKRHEHIGFCFDNDGLYGSLTARENMEFFQRCYRSQQSVELLLSTVGLDATDGRVVSKYSLGMRKRLGLARSLLSEPTLLLLDEPLLGLDPDGQAEFIEQLRKLGTDTSILLSSHDLEAVSSLCTRVIGLSGSVVFDGSVDVLRDETSGAYAGYRKIFYQKVQESE
ncbi:putative ABC transporter ATP-binding protein YxlF [Austwickia sp. TVS 96-490-7B]|uniref:heme ABC exporter ATP-binding protein CcmA n=1 Tax=Austwickia sp. TVS 96-490-7B TaxID=2830843 RepID=UPI001C581B9A|nr:heme ABC exporter ATP-binding protein CcmA [Austwickia sp. TVS 96-490-7B]MBW3084078.1 putative ABC transporter ATP-binding protein YxlF [Austwickia sp. TVS 96-490-7B]